MISGTKVVSIRLSIENVERAKNSSLNLSHWVNSRLNEFYSGGISIPNQVIGESKVSSDLIVNMSEKFISWMRANRFTKSYQKSLENDLIKHFNGLVLTSPQNIIDYLSRMKTTSKYPILALRKYIKYLEETGSLQSNDADNLRRVLKVKKSQPDTYVPTDEVVKQAYNKIKDERVKLYFEILAYSGVRVTEMAKLLSEFEAKNLIKSDTYARYTLNFKRGQKNSFYIYMPIEIANKVKRLYKVDAKEMSKIFDQNSGLTPKYLRKWFYNKVIMAGIPESVADFYEGRSPATVGSANYMEKTRQADHWYETAMKALKPIHIV